VTETVGEADVVGAAEELLDDDEQPATATTRPAAAAMVTATGRTRDATEDTANQPQIWVSIPDNVSSLSPPGRCCRALRPQ
jgi:hypothetical protein